MSALPRLAAVGVAAAVATLCAVLSPVTAVAQSSTVVETSSQNILVRWGSGTDLAQSAAVADLLSGLDGSAYVGGLAEYGITASAQYSGAYLIPAADLPADASSPVTDEAIEKALAATFSDGNVPTPSANTNYVVAFPPSVTLARSGCSFHFEFTAGGVATHVIGLPDYANSVATCGGGAQDAAGTASVNASRQVVNTVTDPFADDSGVTGPNLAEIGDSCVGTGLASVDARAVQQWYSSAQSTCTAGAPQVRVTTRTPSATSADWAVFDLHDSDPLGTSSAFACTIDGAALPCAAGTPAAVQGLAPGSHIFAAEATDDTSGRSRSLGSSQRSWLIDVDPPVARVMNPATPVTLVGSVRVRLGGTDAGGSGIAGYDVRYRSAAWNAGFGSWVSPASWQGAAVSAVSLRVGRGRTYCFSARAHDRAGNTSTAWSPTWCTSVALDDRAASRSTAGWALKTGLRYYRGTVSRSLSAGATLRLAHARLSGLALVVRTCPTCGRIAVYRNGVYWRTVGTAAATGKYRVIVRWPAFSLRTATITLRAAGSRPVFVDGIAVLRS